MIESKNDSSDAEYSSDDEISDKPTSVMSTEDFQSNEKKSEPDDASVSNNNFSENTEPPNNNDSNGTTNSDNQNSTNNTNTKKSNQNNSSTNTPTKIIIFSIFVSIIAILAIIYRKTSIKAKIIKPTKQDQKEIKSKEPIQIEEHPSNINNNV